MGLAHEKKSYLQEKANLFEIGSICFYINILQNVEKNLQEPLPGVILN